MSVYVLEDLSDKGLECEDMNNNIKYPYGCFIKRKLVEEDMCRLRNNQKPSLWRGGPAGPKSLCNACGIRSRKKRRV